MEWNQRVADIKLWIKLGQTQKSRSWFKRDSVWICWNDNRGSMGSFSIYCILKIIFQYPATITCVYSYVPDKLTGFLESLSTVLAAVRKAAPVDVLLVIPGAGRERPVGKKQTYAKNMQHLSIWSSVGFISVICLIYCNFQHLKSDRRHRDAGALG